MVKIFIYGSSNTLISNSYVQKIKKKYDIINRGLGATTTIIGSLRLKDDIPNIEDDDIIIHDYYVTDQNQSKNNLIEWDTVLKNLEYFIKMCSAKKLVSILIKTIPDFKKEEHINQYIDLLNKYNVSFIDTSKLINNNLSLENIKKNYYEGELGNGFNHLNEKFYNLISEFFFLNISKINRLKKYNINLIHKLVFKKNLEFSNSIVKTNYTMVNKSNPFKIQITQPMRLVTIEYLCDKYSGIIQIKTDNAEYYITTLKNEPIFIFKREKTLLTNLTFNETIIIDKYLSINLIDYSQNLKLTSYHKKDYLIPKKDNIVTELNFKIINIIVDKV